MNEEENEQFDRSGEGNMLYESLRNADIGKMADSTDELAPSGYKDRQSGCAIQTQTCKMVIGVAIVIGIAVSWVGATQFAQSTYSPDFNAPFFTTWFSTIWMFIVFPVYFLPSLLRGKHLLLCYRESEKIFGSRGLHLMSLFTHAGPFCIIWIVTNYLYIRALGVIHAADVTALFLSSNAFVYILSWIWLKEKLSIFKISAVLLSIGGIVLMAYAEGFGGPNAVGVVLCVAAAIGAAVYKVFFKRMVGDATLAQVSLFLSCLGLLATFLFWPIIVIFQFTDYERVSWSHMPWEYLCGSGALALIFNFLINFGIAFTYPLFISLGTVIGIPLNALTDLVFRDTEFGILKIVAVFFIIMGFLFMLIPESYEEHLQEKIGCKKKESLDINELEYEL